MAEFEKRDISDEKSRQIFGIMEVLIVVKWKYCKLIVAQNGEVSCFSISSSSCRRIHVCNASGLPMYTTREKSI
jgi:hypothetical protein